MTVITIAVVGSTGVQGGGVVSALISDPSFNVKAITSNPKSTHAQALLSKYQSHGERFQLVHGNLNDEDSLKKALEGCQGLFASWGPGATPKKGKVGEEVTQGKNLVRAAKAVGIERFVYSTLTSMKEESKGKYTEVHHHESKVEVEKFAKENIQHVTSIMPSAFYSNLNGPGWTRRAEDGTAVFCAPFNSNVRLAWTDAGYDVGNYTLAILKQGPEVTSGKMYLCASSPLKSIEEIAVEYHKITGEPVAIEPLTTKEGGALTAKALGIDDTLAKELEDTFSHFNAAYAGAPSEAIDYPNKLVFEELGVKASTFASYLERSGWRVKGP